MNGKPIESYDYLCVLGALNPVSDEVLNWMPTESNPEKEYLKEEAFFSLSTKARQLISSIFNPKTNEMKSIIKKALSSKDIKKDLEIFAGEKEVFEEIREFVDSDNFRLPAKAGFTLAGTTKPQKWGDKIKLNGDYHERKIK